MISAFHQNRHLQNEEGQLVYVIANRVDILKQISMYVYIYGYTACVHIYIYIYIYIRKTLACHSKLELEVIPTLVLVD